MLSAVHYPAALSCGLTPDAFWDLSLAEIEDIILSRREKDKQDAKVQIDRLFTLADAIANRVSFILAGKDKGDLIMIQPWDLYPKLFPGMKEEVEEAEQKRELERYKESQRQRAARMKMKREEGEG